MATWTEYGVQLAAGIVAPASSEHVARSHARGFPVHRTVICTALPKSGDAHVQTREWKFLRGAA